MKKSPQISAPPIWLPSDLVAMEQQEIANKAKARVPVVKDAYRHPQNWLDKDVLSAPGASLQPPPGVGEAPLSGRALAVMSKLDEPTSLTSVGEGQPMLDLGLDGELGDIAWNATAFRLRLRDLLFLTGNEYQFDERVVPKNGRISRFLLNNALKTSHHTPGFCFKLIWTMSGLCLPVRLWLAEGFIYHGRGAARSDARPGRGPS